jgi:alcohol dehydrogenase (cytochrome c)
VTDIEMRSGVDRTAGGLVFTALQDGWIVAYNDETLQELWRFNVGTPAEGRAGHLRDRPEAVSRGAGRWTPSAPCELDKLENSSYLFVFALD